MNGILSLNKLAENGFCWAGLTHSCVSQTKQNESVSKILLSEVLTPSEKGTNRTKKCVDCFSVASEM